MASKHTYAVETRCAREDVFAIYTDLGRWRNRGMYGEIQWVEGRPWQVGSRLEFEMNFPGHQKVRQLISDIVAAKRVSLITHSSGITLHSTIDFTDIPGGGTRIDASLESVGITAFLFGFAIESVVERSLRRFLDDLKTDCDNFAASQSDRRA